MAASTKIWTNDNPPQVDDVDLNGFERENNFLIQTSGLGLNTSDNYQTSKAVSNYVAGADYYTCSGAANAYILTESSNAPGVFISPTNYFDGFRIRFIPNVSNTGPATVNVAGIGVVPLQRANGATLEADDLPTDAVVVGTYITSGFRIISIGNSTSSSPDARNVVIGGCAGTNPWQRQVTKANIFSTSGYHYVADRFYVRRGANTTAEITYARSTDVPLISVSKYFSSNSFGFTVTTAQSSFPGADEGVWAGYAVEGYDFAKLTQQNIVVSFVAKASIAGVYSIALQNSNATYSVVKTVNLTTSYQLFVLTFPPSPSVGTWNYTNGIGLNILFAMSPSSYQTSTLDVWQNSRLQTATGQTNLIGTNGATLHFDQFFVAPGSTFSTYNEPVAATIWESCQRYYQSTYEPGVYPGSINSVNSRRLCTLALTSSGNSVVMPEILLPKILRSNNGIATFYNPTTGAANELHLSGIGADVNTTSISTYTNRILYTLSGPLLNTGYIVEGDFAIECELGIV